MQNGHIGLPAPRAGMNRVVSEFLTDDHRDCDKCFAAAEAAASEGDLEGARSGFGDFESALLTHLAREEEVLFPEFEKCTGMADGPTAIMRMEHGQIRSLVVQMRQALVGGDLEEFLGLGETMNILIQQHNMKEEYMLYPMCDQALTDAPGSLVDRMRTTTAG